MILRDGATFIVENPTQDELNRLDKALTRVSPDVQRWWAPEANMIVRFDEKTRTMWLPRSNKLLEDMLDQKYQRVDNLRWLVPEDGITLSRVVDYASAKLSGKLDKDDPIVQQRLASCLGCDALKKTENGGWCIPCGCGNKNLMVYNNQPAEKMLFRTLNCPKFMPGYSNAVK